MYRRVRKFGAEMGDRSVASSRERQRNKRAAIGAKRKTGGSRKVGCIENEERRSLMVKKTRWRGQQQNHAEAGGY